MQRCLMATRWLPRWCVRHAPTAEDRFLTNRANMDMADRVISIVALVFGAVCVCALLAHVLFV